jgi:pimeloyl-ACP methyl ester carboxylesterase
MELRQVSTRSGRVEIGDYGGDGRPVLFFPGGHSSAATPTGAGIYSELGLRPLVFSRPGYGHTSVGDLRAAEFVRPVLDVVESLGLDDIAAVVGLSFGGQQAIELVAAAPELAPKLVLHSCAPSSLPFPDTSVERRGAPVAFNPVTQRLTWAAVRRLVRSDRGLRSMMGSLSTVPVDEWWDDWTDADRDAARSMFAAMDSGSGFLLDCSQATRERNAYRAAALGRVSCPSLVTASRLDGGVSFAHSEDFVRLIPRARLVDTGASSHLAWLGPSRRTLVDAVAEFLAE